MKTKAIVLEQYNRNIIRALLGLKEAETELPEPGPDEVLIKVHAAPCNPSDIAFMQGGCNIVKALPAVPGFEGSGTIVETGKNIPAGLAGKKVSFFIQDDRPGSWAGYVVAHKRSIILLDDRMDLDQAACFSVNPLTAFAMVEEARKTGTKGIIQNASGGQVAHFIRKIATGYGMEVIDVVRKEENAAALRNGGAKHVLVETDTELKEKLKLLARETDALIAFDAVAGEQSGILFNALPENGRLIIYGGLSNKPVSGLNALDIIFKNKTVTGFNLPQWKSGLTEKEFEEIINRLPAKFIDGTLKTAIQGETGFKNIAKGLRNYITNMSAGKILIKPGL